MSDKQDRIYRLSLGVLAGILLGNISWVMPSAMAWGGTWSIIGLIFMSMLCVILIWMGVETNS